MVVQLLIVNYKIINRLEVNDFFLGLLTRGDFTAIIRFTLKDI